MDAKTRRLFGTLALAAALAVAAPTRALDDSALFTTAVPPNVVLFVDNSGSMNELVWHPDYLPSVTYSCNTTNGGYTTEQRWTTNQLNQTRCGTTRNYYVDPLVTAVGNSTRFSAGYLNWIHSLPNGDPRLAELAATNNGTYTPCLQAEGYTTYDRYRRARISAARDVLREVICNVNLIGEVRFGLAQFRLEGGSDDPNGGYIMVPVNDYNVPTYTLNGISDTHGGHLDRAIDAIEGESWTPLGETLFQLYTYFMSRTTSDIPFGINGTTRFPAYTYRTNKTGNYGSHTTTASSIPIDPVQYDCQKNFVIMITDGQPTKDDFDNSNSGDNTSNGFSIFTSQLIGDYSVDGETEINGAACGGVTASDECALYLDDIAKFMHERDFRPDRPGTQVLDVYTVGFTTNPYANNLLSRTAAVGNGLFYYSNNAEQLAQAIVSAVTDIIQKSQSFTAATVPATRTSDGGNFYTSLFVPALRSQLWEGHLKLFQITSAGDILDATGNCALLNPSPPGECKSGQVAPAAPAFWDAGAEIPAPGSRALYTSLPVSGTPQLVDFDTSLTYTALGDPASALDDLTLASLLLYPGSGATTVEGLADAIIENLRGCRMGTGVTNACVPRPWLLGDIFHSNPLVVGNPRGFVSDPSYIAFRQAHAQRDKMIFAGANDGFLHAFHAGDWQALTSPPGYDRGTGEEIFGFMPWPARRNARQLPIDTGARDYYFVDGSPAAADVWFYSSPTQTTKAASGSEWHTILAGGLRQGGKGYYALDVSDPTAATYPDYLWEFPAENASATLQQYMGQTWGQPILTRIKVRIAGQAYERSVVVVTGGYDPSGDPNDPLNYDPNATAGRAIFILDAKTGEILGEKKFDPAASGAESEMLYAIAATPSVFDLNADGFSDVVFVGDLGGNLWKWVLRDLYPNNYAVDPINDTGSTSQPNLAFRRFFQATPTPSDPLGVSLGGADYYKSIFYSPAGTLRNGKLWLAFGTGERANLKRLGDSTSTDENDRFYAIQDLDPYELATPANPVTTESVLYDATADSSCADLTGYAGYFFRGADNEKFITNVELFSHNVITASFTPNASADPCSAGGDATLYLFRLYCGEGYFAGPADGTNRMLDLGAGMPTDPKITVSPDGTRVIVTQQDGEIENPPCTACGSGSAPGQLYWREIFTQ